MPRRLLGLLAAVLLPLTGAFAQDPATCTQNCPAPFVPNTFWTTEYGPAPANVLLAPTNFLACPSSAYALCYYSGPNTPPGKKKVPLLPCKVSASDPTMADCRCFAETGVSYVDINAIRNTEAWVETVRACGLNGENCRNMESEALAGGKIAAALGGARKTLQTAPVCSYLVADSSGKAPMEPGAELVSTFSFARSETLGLKLQDCAAAPYAGCMTASCKYERDAKDRPNGFATCHCPIYTGPYQIGLPGASCSAGTGYVWSAAYTPPSTSGK